MNQKCSEWEKINFAWIFLRIYPGLLSTAASVSPEEPFPAVFLALRCQHAAAAVRSERLAGHLETDNMNGNIEHSTLNIQHRTKRPPGVVGQFAIFRSAAVPAAAGGKGNAFEIFEIRSEFSCAAGEDTRAPIKLIHHPAGRFLDFSALNVEC
jgi:hypothetical protein